MWVKGQPSLDSENRSWWPLSAPRFLGAPRPGVLCPQLPCRGWGQPLARRGGSLPGAEEKSRGFRGSAGKTLCSCDVPVAMGEFPGSSRVRGPGGEVMAAERHSVSLSPWNLTH